MPEEGGFGADRGGMMGSDDVYLIYTDDDPESYPNIFDNAKTDVSAQARAWHGGAVGAQAEAQGGA